LNLNAWRYPLGKAMICPRSSTAFDTFTGTSSKSATPPAEA
jgi:hypothetical protein